MTLAMSRPSKHPRTGIFWLRKRVPADLRAALGKTELTKSLGTRDPAEAKRLHAAALATIEGEWAALRRPPVQRLKEADIEQFEQSLCERWLAHHRLGDVQKFWRTDLCESLWQPSVSPFLVVVPSFPLQLTVDDHRYDGDVDALWSMKMFAYQCGDGFALERAVVPDDDERLRLAKAAARAVQQASVQLKPRLGWGDIDQRRLLAGSPNSPPRPISTSAGGGTTKATKFSELIDGWTMERKPGKKPLICIHAFLVS